MFSLGADDDARALAAGTGDLGAAREGRGLTSERGGLRRSGQERPGALGRVSRKGVVAALGASFVGDVFCGPPHDTARSNGGAYRQMFAAEWLMHEENATLVEACLLDAGGLDGLIRWAMSSVSRDASLTLPISCIARALSLPVLMSAPVALAFAKHGLFGEFQAHCCTRLEDWQSQNTDVVDSMGLLLQNQAGRKQISKELLRGDGAGLRRLARLVAATYDDLARAQLGPDGKVANLAAKLAAMICNASGHRGQGLAVGPRARRQRRLSRHV